MLFSRLKQCSQITLILSLFFLASPTTFADDEKAARDALLLIASGGHIEAVQQLEALASNGNSSAQLELSTLHLSGHFLPIDMAKSGAYAAAAAENGNQLAIYFQAQSSGDLGALYSLLDQGFELAACGLLEVDSEVTARCRQEVNRLASTGDAQAIYWLATMFDESLAADLLEKFPHPYVIAEIAFEKWGKRPTQELLDLLLSINELGSVKTPVYIIQDVFLEDSVAWKLERDKLVGDLPEESKAHLRDALRSLIDGDHAGWFGSEWYSNNHLGALYANGNLSLEIEPDFGLAFKAYANCSESEIQSTAGSCLHAQAELKRRGGPNLEQSLIDAVSLYTRASNKGNSAATGMLANSFRYGLGVTQNFSRAAMYYEKAINQGNLFAAANLAELYLNGQGVAKDMEKAASLFELAIVGDGSGGGYSSNGLAMLALAEIHENGSIDGASLSQANLWYKAAMNVPAAYWDTLDDEAEEIVSFMDQQKAKAADGFKRTSEEILRIASSSSPRDAHSSNSDAFGKYEVLIIANESYQSLVDLKTPQADALAVGAALKNRFGAHVEYLFNATRVEMLAALNRYRKELEPSDNFILYYAGHGIYDEELNIGYWQPVDGTPDEDYTWIDTDRVSRTLSGFKSRNALVIADSCYSGSVVRGNEFTALESHDTSALLALSAKKTRMAITSGGLQPVLDSTGNSETSAFASNLATALYAVDRPLPISSLFPILRGKVTAESAAWGFEQVPEMAPLYKAGHDGGDFILSPRAKGPE